MRNHKWARMLETLRRDGARYQRLGGWAWHPGFWIVAMHRYGIWARTFRSPVLRFPLRALYHLCSLPWTLLLNVAIHTDRIGPGLCLIHPRNILVGAGVEIGEDCLVFHEVTVATGPKPGQPRIGDGVDLYVGARVLGGVTIGDGCLVGANSVVTRDVPPNSVVLAAPARIISRALVARSAPRHVDEGSERRQEPSATVKANESA